MTLHIHVYIYIYIYIYIYTSPIEVQLEDLVKANGTFVRPILKHAASEWNQGVTGHQINHLERIQRQTLLMILPDLNYKEL